MTQVPPTPARPPVPDKKTLDALYRVFQHFALEDQRKYYRSSVTRYRKAADQVNHFRAIFALVAGLAAAAAGLIVGVTATDANCRLDFVSASSQIQVTPAATQPSSPDAIGPSLPPAPSPSSCFNVRALVFALVILATVSPAVAAAFATLSDVYQWDRVITVYEAALENLEVADAQSPLPEMDDLVYRASLRAYAEGTLTVMRDETAQWGQLPKPPERLEKFIAEEREKAAKASGVPNDAPGAAEPPTT